MTRCNARSEFGGAAKCQLEVGHKGLHWDNIIGHFYSKDDNRIERDSESEAIRLKSMQEYNKSLLRDEGSVCNCSAGLCPKFEHTFGEGHYCDLPIFHEGEHHCRCCDNTFNSDSVIPWTYQHK